MKETWTDIPGLDPRKFLYGTTKMMQAVGILQSPNPKWRRTYYIYSSIILLLIFLQTFTQVMDFILNSRNITTIARNGIFTLLSLNSVFKAVWLWRKQPVVLTLLADMNENFRIVPPARSFSQDLKNVNKGVKGAYSSFLNLTIMAYVYWITSPLIQYATEVYHRDVSGNSTVQPIAIYEMGYALPARAWFPFEVFYYPMYYIAYTVQFVSLTYIVFISISVDLLCIMTLMRINAQLMFLAADLETASEAAFLAVAKNRGEILPFSVVESLRVDTPMEEYLRELIGIGRTCVGYHVDIMRIIRRFDKVLGGLALMTTRLYTLILVVGAMKIVEAHGIDANSIQLMVYWTCFVYQLYLFFSIADDIVQSQLLLANGVEEGLWGPTSNANRELAYLITRITMMANKPAYFTAGYLKMNRNTYKTEIQQVASMFNALWQMKHSGRM